MTINKFNIRVYGIVLNERNEVLLSDEYMLDTKMTKFPGGGLHFGEGTADCIRREAIEEFGQEIEIIEHFYTTDFFQQAMFYTDMQLISIYYMVRFKGPIMFKVSDKPFDFGKPENGKMSFRWVSIKQLNSNDLTFPIDRKVALLLKEAYV
ncbi:MAG: NUDIX domain-containing protein [Bacteroidales bacterium]|nr:NUDIX domain-containing protein [Bacteroidales bacterium]